MELALLAPPLTLLHVLVSLVCATHASSVFYLIYINVLLILALGAQHGKLDAEHRTFALRGTPSV
jgi:hypothetical protein